jgi:multiple sugar transport system substrate-binding protein
VKKTNYSKERRNIMKMKRKKGNKRAISRREFLATSAAAAAGVFLGGGVKRAYAAKTQIKFLTFEASPVTIPIFKKIIAEFEAKHPDVEVKPEFLAFDTHQARIAQIVAARETAGVVTVCDGFHLSGWMKAALVEPMTDLVNEVGDIFDQFRFVYNGQDFYIPYVFKPFHSFYRSDLFEKDNIAPPTNAQEYLQAVRKVTKGEIKGCLIAANPGSTYTETQFLSYLWSDNTPVVDYINGKWEVVLDKGSKAGTIEVLNWMKEMEKYSMGEAAKMDFGRVNRSYATGKFATIDYPSRVFLDIIQYNPQLADVTKPMRLPYFKTPKARCWVNGYAIFKGGKETGLYKEFVKSLITGRNYLEILWSVPMHLIPVSKKLFEGQWQENPFIQKRRDIFNLVKQIIPEQRPEVLGIEGNRISLEMGVMVGSGILGKMVSNVVVGNQNAAEVIDKTAKELRSLFATL